jgi:hypothetical protein
MSHHHPRTCVHPDLPPLSSVTTAVESGAVAESDARAVIMSAGRYHTAAEPRKRLVAVTATHRTPLDAGTLPGLARAR